jgi:hypothetical protein
MRTSPEKLYINHRSIPDATFFRNPPLLTEYSRGVCRPQHSFQQSPCTCNDGENMDPWFRQRDGIRRQTDGWRQIPYLNLGARMNNNFQAEIIINFFAMRFFPLVFSCHFLVCRPTKELNILSTSSPEWNDFFNEKIPVAKGKEPLSLRKRAAYPFLRTKYVSTTPGIILRVWMQSAHPRKPVLHETRRQIYFEDSRAG